jgi:ammonia channel protein AmtB
MVRLNDTRLMYGLAGSSMVITGVVIKNSLEQLKLSESKMSMIGMMLFLIGWVVFGYAMGLNTGDDSHFVYLPIAAIIGAVMLMKKTMKSCKGVPKYSQ